MTFYSVSNPFMQVLNLQGTGLNDGDVYFGVAGQDPITHPISVYWDLAGTQLAPQPIETTGGYLYRSGTPAAVYLGSTYSIKVLDKGGDQVYYEANVFDPVFQISADLAAFEASLAASTGATLIGWISRYASAIAGTVADYLDDRCSVMHFIPFIERVKIRARTSTADLASYFASAAATGDEVFVPAGTYNKSGTVTMGTAGTSFVGAGMGTVITQTDSTVHAFELAQSYVGVRNLRINGSATSGQSEIFAIHHTTGVTAENVLIENVLFSGADSGHGNPSGIKFDTGANYPTVRGCRFEYLKGTASGQGYGVLASTNGAIIQGNVFLGDSNGMRHGVYLPSGASYCKVLNNFASNTNYESFTINTSSSQPVSAYNLIEGNTALNPSTVGGSENFSGISIFGKSQNNTVANNTIINSGGCGIKIDGTQQMPNQNNRVHGNTIVAAAYTGIDVLDMAGGAIIDNAVENCSTASTGTYPAIRLASGGQPGATGCTKIVLDSNDTSGADARCGLQLNSTAPTPTHITVDGNLFRHAVPVEFNGVICPINGMFEFTFGGHVRPIITAGTPYTPQLTCPGVKVGDYVETPQFGANNDGLVWTGQVVTDGKVDITVINGNSGTPKATATASLYIGVTQAAANAAL